MHKPLSFYTMLVCKNVCITYVYVHGRSSASKKTKIDFPSQSDASSSPQFFSSLTRYYSFSLYPIYHSSPLFSLYPSSSCPLSLLSPSFRDTQPMDLISSNHLMETDRLSNEVLHLYIHIYKYLNLLLCARNACDKPSRFGCYGEAQRFMFRM